MRLLQKLSLSLIASAIPSPFIVGFFWGLTTKESTFPNEGLWAFVNAILGTFTAPLLMIVSPSTFHLWPHVFGCFAILFVVSLVIAFDLYGPVKGKNF
jgi:hypothetical protein